MRLNLFQQEKPAKEHIDIYYTDMTLHLQQIITVIQDGAPRLEGRLEDERVLLPLGDIYYVETVDRRTFLYMKKDVYHTDLTLTDFIDTFWEYGFARVNKSQIVNLHKIQRINPTAGMRIVAVLDNEEKLIINRSFRNSFEEALQLLGRAHREKVDQ